jgi:hypothetical protein
LYGYNVQHIPFLFRFGSVLFSSKGTVLQVCNRNYISNCLCTIVPDDQKLATTNKTYWSIKTTDPNKLISVVDYAGMADFCWRQRCGPLGQLATIDELETIRSSSLLANIFPVENAIGRAGSRRYVYTGLTLR